MFILIYGMLMQNNEVFIEVPFCFTYLLYFGNYLRKWLFFDEFLTKEIIRSCLICWYFLFHLSEMNFLFNHYKTPFLLYTEIKNDIKFSNFLHFISKNVLG